MSLAADLLQQARMLTRHEPRRPRQATLRRAISTMYYALFHLLADSSARSLIGHGSQQRRLRHAIQRGFDHTAMKQCCRAFASGGLPPALSSVLSVPPTPDIQLVARAFFQLQEARHAADYDMNRIFQRSETQGFLLLVEEAFVAWERVRNTSEAQVFLVSLLLWKLWNRA